MFTTDNLNDAINYIGCGKHNSLTQKIKEWSRIPAHSNTDSRLEFKIDRRGDEYHITLIRTRTNTMQTSTRGEVVRGDRCIMRMWQEFEYNPFPNGSYNGMRVSSPVYVRYINCDDQ